MNARRIAAALRQMAAACEDIAAELEPEHETEPSYAEPGSEMAKVDEMLAQVYLARALRRYSPTRTPSA